MYFDTSYIAKFCLTEPESRAIREIVRKADFIYSSLWATAEFHAVLHRHVREGSITARDSRTLAARFAEHVDEQLWRLAPVNETIIRKTAALILSAPNGMFLRATDALHLTTALEIGEEEVWTNDRHMLAAMPHFGLTGRSV